MIVVMLLIAVALDLTRCGLVLAAARHPAPAAGLVAAGLVAAALTARTARGCRVGQRWAGWAALLIGAASAPQAAASGFRAPYTIPDAATAALGTLLAITILATAGRIDRWDTTPKIPVCWTGASRGDPAQETFIRAWRHLPQLSADGRPIRPWLFRVARNLLIDANRAAQARPMTVPGPPAAEAGTDSGLEEILDRQLVSDALRHLSPAHQTVLLETFYRGGTMATVARELGIPHGTARSRLHYALDAMRKQLQEHDAIAAS